MNYKITLAVGIGGIVGAVGRFGLSALFVSESFPVATLAANWIGCFLLNFIINHSIKQRLSPGVFAGISIGLIGAFTTFSTLAVETVQLWSIHYFSAIAYILLSVFGGLTCCYIGYWLGTRKQAVS